MKKKVQHKATRKGIVLPCNSEYHLIDEEGNFVSVEPSPIQAIFRATENNIVVQPLDSTLGKGILAKYQEKNP